MPVIEVEHLHKRYGEKVAVDDVSFTVERGEIFGILGPNGAGKTTTAECLEGLRVPDRGTLSVLGLDPQRDKAELRQRVGIQLQESQLPDKLRVGEALDLYRSTSSPRWACRTSGTRRTRSSPAGRNSGCPSRWR